MSTAESKWLKETDKMIADARKAKRTPQVVIKSVNGNTLHGITCDTCDTFLVEDRCPTHG
jgi:hypothetical protein